jgi:hypothetical protein
MRDPELVARAQQAAARLESAWERWRALQGLGETSAQPVVGYVGYALKEPWGQPRAVIGFSAEEAERLAELLERGCGGADRAADQDLEITRQRVPSQSLAQVFPVAPAIKPDILAVTSQLYGSHVSHSFLPGTSDRLRITRAGKQRLYMTSGLGTARPRPEPRLLIFGAVAPSPGRSCAGLFNPCLAALRSKTPARRLTPGCPWADSGPSALPLVSRPGSPRWCSTCTGSPRSGSCSGTRGSPAWWPRPPS